MDYFYGLVAKDQPDINWLFRPSTTELAWDEFRHAYCETCRGFDVIRALKKNRIASKTKLKVRKGTDFFTTHDGVSCVSERVFQKLNKEQIEGVEFLSLPNDPFYAVKPRLFAKMDVEHADLADLYVRECPDCTNPRVGGWAGPTVAALGMKPKKSFQWSLFTVKPILLTTELMCSAEVMKMLKELKIRGLELHRYARPNE